MTEAEWLSCADPFALFAHLDTSGGWRKRQLYCLACWDRVVHLLVDDYSRKGLAYLEAHATFDWTDPDADDHEKADRSIVDVDHELNVRFWERFGNGLPQHAGFEAGAAFAVAAEALYSGWVRGLREERPAPTAAQYAARIAANAAETGDGPLAVWRQRQRLHADLVREIFGNPFRASVIYPAWLAWNGGVAATLAEALDEEEAYDRMPILGDALEDAGCADDALLAHLRSAGPHVRGCWALDLILGKS